MLKAKIFSKNEELNKELNRLEVNVIGTLEVLDDIDVLLIYEECQENEIIKELKDKDKKVYIINPSGTVNCECDGTIKMYANIAIGIKSLATILENKCSINIDSEEIINKLNKKSMIITDKVEKLGIMRSKLAIGRDIDIDLHLNIIGKNLKLSDGSNILSKFDDIKLNSIMYNVTELELDDIYVSMIIKNINI